MAKDKKVKQENKETKPKTYEQGFIDGRKAEKRRVMAILKKFDMLPKKKE